MTKKFDNEKRLSFSFNKVRRIVFITLFWVVITVTFFSGVLFAKIMIIDGFINYYKIAENLLNPVFTVNGWLFSLFFSALMPMFLMLSINAYLYHADTELVDKIEKTLPFIKYLTLALQKPILLLGSVGAFFVGNIAYLIQAKKLALLNYVWLIPLFFFVAACLLRWAIKRLDRDNPEKLKGKTRNAGHIFFVSFFFMMLFHAFVAPAIDMINFINWIGSTGKQFLF